MQRPGRPCQVAFARVAFLRTIDLTLRRSRQRGRSRGNWLGMSAESLDHPARRDPARGACEVPLRVHLFAWGVMAALVVVLLGLVRHYEGRDFWQGWTESRELRQPGYAERIYRQDFFRTRANSWSNLAYVLVGLYALGLAADDWRKRQVRSTGYVAGTPAMSLLFGLACCYLGFGSGLYHASLTRWGQQLDVAAMYAPLLAGAALYLGRWGREARAGRSGVSTFLSWPWLSGVVLIACYLLYRYKWSMSSQTVLTTLILLVGLLGLADVFLARQRMRFRWLGWSALALGMAVACRQLDVAGKFSGPDAWLQGHALWHLLTALSLACLYAYHRDEAVALPPMAPRHS